jgi:murein DD-endopeptidase MepM/ murein hydrolase activator NlpD
MSAGTAARRVTAAGLALLLVVGLVLVQAVAARPAARAAVTPAGDSERARTMLTDRFWTDDTSFYRSRWFAGQHRIMIPFGCTEAPYYDPDPRCPNRQGFHHGIDIAMPCGTRLFAGYRGRVVWPSSSGALGSGYGSKAFRLRHDGYDFVIGHVRRVYVEPGQRVRRGQLIARAGALGAPDGCHLHFEVRPAGGGYTSAVRPRAFLGLNRVD